MSHSFDCHCFPNFDWAIQVFHSQVITRPIQIEKIIICLCWALCLARRATMCVCNFLFSIDVTCPLCEQLSSGPKHSEATILCCAALLLFAIISLISGTLNDRGHWSCYLASVCDTTHSLLATGQVVASTPRASCSQCTGVGSADQRRLTAARKVMSIESKLKLLNHLPPFGLPVDISLFFFLSQHFPSSESFNANILLFGFLTFPCVDKVCFWFGPCPTKLTKSLPNCYLTLVSFCHDNF